LLLLLLLLLRLLQSTDSQTYWFHKQAAAHFQVLGMV
jgi:hypothetical protein